MYQLTSVTPTVCSLMGIAAPKLSTDQVYKEAISRAYKKIGAQAINKCLIYAPDALGSHLIAQYPDTFSQILQYAPVAIPTHSVKPAFTPICFSSMFTGALPELHGRVEFERTQLNCDTLFDALLRAGKKVAIIAVKNCSVDLIFRGRAIDYFSEVYDQEVTEKALEVIELDQHDFILVYHQEYDDQLHETIPTSPECLKAMNNHVASFSRLSESFFKKQARNSSMVFFTPDHGAYVDPKTGKGNHGLNLPEDDELTHFFGCVVGE